jgi:AcrR family transcriptional regulator
MVIYEMNPATPELTPETGRRERRRTETRARIFDSAMNLFARHGFVDTKVESITKAADVAKGTFFNYFPSKEAIVAEMAKRLMVGLAGVADQAQREDTVLPALQALPEHIVSGPGRSPVLFRSLMGTVLLNRPLTTLFEQIAGNARQQIARIVARGQELGEIRNDIDADELARSFQQYAWGTLVMWSLLGTDDVRARLALTVEIFWKGVAAEVRDEMWMV